MEVQKETNEAVKKAENAGWITMKPAEIEALIVELAKQGQEASMIGMILRDSYGIPSTKKMVGKNVKQILEEAGITELYDLKNLVKKADSLKKHLEQNKQDKTAKRGLQIIEARIRKVERYQARKTHSR